MAEVDLEAIRARIRNLADAQAAGPSNFADLEPEQLWQVAMAYAQDVPALLDHIAELEREITIMDTAHQQQVAGLKAELATEDKHRQQLTSIVVHLREQHAAAMAIVRAVAESTVVPTDDEWALSWPDSAFPAAAGIYRGEARALLAGQAGKE